MSRDHCRTHGTPFTLSMIGVPYCPLCRQSEKAALQEWIDRGHVVTDKKYIGQIESAADAESLRRS